MIEVKKTLHGCHEVISQWRSMNREDHNTPVQKRRLLIMDAFLKAAERRALKVSYTVQKQGFYVTITKDRDSVEFGVREKHKREKEKITDPKKDYFKKGYNNVLVPTGVLILTINPGYKDYRPAELQDQDGHPLEQQLQDAMKALEKSFLAQQDRRLEREKWHHEREERAAYLRDLEEKKKQEQQKKDLLEDKVNCHLRASNIRNYVSEVLQANKDGKINLQNAELLAWKTWALAYADDLDPIVSKGPL